MSRVPVSVLSDRIERIREKIAAEDVDAGIWFDSTSIEYLVGFPHVITERPVVLVITQNRVQLLVPRLEVDRAASVDIVDGVCSYFDYPCDTPMHQLRELLADKRINSVAADAEQPPSVMGYRGPALSSFVQSTIQSWVGEFRRTKSAQEQVLLTESGEWATRIHEYVSEFVRPGVSPVVASERLMTAGTKTMTEEYGDEYDARTRFNGPVTAGFVSGTDTAIPHAYTSNEPISTGDQLITGVVIDIGGYTAELERTMFVGEPDDDQRAYFEIMLEAQKRAFDAIEPGVSVGHVDTVTRDYFESEGVLDLVQHHVGHGIGMEAHEPPYLDRGSDATIQVGDVYAVEPALYTESGGYRHSDTLIVTEQGAERITTTPRDLEANIIPTT